MDTASRLGRIRGGLARDELEGSGLDADPLDSFSPPADGYTVHPTSLTLVDAVRASLDRLKQLVQDRVVIDVPQGLRITGDPWALDRILSNLLTNAVTFSPPGSPIHVTAMPDDDHVVVGVRDCGPGVPSGKRERVFEAFYRCPGGPEPGGMGVGLAVVRRYVELHGGHAWMERAPEGGAAVFFTLPRTTSNGPFGAGGSAGSNGSATSGQLSSSGR